jgi:hypothetical protein
MRKRYVLNAKRNSASIIITGKGGVRVRFNFTNGNVNMNQPASFVTENEYYQRLIEESDYVKKGLIRMAQIIGGDKKKAESKGEQVVTGIKGAQAAIEWVADTFGVKVTSGRAAIDYAKKQGYLLKE